MISTSWEIRTADKKLSASDQRGKGKTKVLHRGQAESVERGTAKRSRGRRYGKSASGEGEVVGGVKKFAATGKEQGRWTKEEGLRPLSQTKSLGENFVRGKSNAFRE